MAATTSRRRAWHLVFGFQNDETFDGGLPCTDARAHAMRPYNKFWRYFAINLPRFRSMPTCPGLSMPLLTAGHFPDALIASLMCICTTTGLNLNLPAFAQKAPLEGGIQEKNYVPENSSSYPAYPSYPSYPAAPAPNSYRPSALNGTANQSNQAPLLGGVTKVSLPPAFLGTWDVRGIRKSVEAQPEFQQGAERAFSRSNEQTWSIKARGEGYTLGSDTGIETPMFVDKVQGTTAFFRYQHPVGNTVAQEAIVMSLTAGGAEFNGLERISIVKQGIPQPRAKVTYSLSGTRQ